MDIVPINDLKRMPDGLADALEQATREVLRSGWWINGPRSAAFCESFAQSLGIPHCIGVGNGTDALEIALRVLIDSWRAKRTPEGSIAEVVTVANAGGYTTTACRHVGCTPVYADIEPGSLLISIGSAIEATSDKTAVIVVTHLYGGLVDVPALRRALDAVGRSDVAILEDCAQAHGLTGAFGKAGTLGTMATYSFYPTKNLGAMGDGGAIVTGDAELADASRRLGQYGWGEKYRVMAMGGRNSRLDEIQAAFLSLALPTLAANNARRAEILNAYAEAANDGVRMVTSPHGNVGHLAVVASPARDTLRDFMHSRGIATDIHYPVLDCDQAGWSGEPIKCAPAGLAVSRASVREILTLPCFPTMKDEEISRVCEALATFGTP